MDDYETHIGRPRKPAVDIPEYDDLVNIFAKVTDAMPEVGQIFVTKYLTGSRLNEWPAAIKTKEKDGRWYIMVRLNTLKNPTQKLRTVPIHMEKEKELLTIMKEFWNRYRDAGNFWGTDRTLQKWYKKWIQMYLPRSYPHFLREFRIHHVISDNDRLGLPIYREDQLCQYFGWSDFDSAAPYRHLREANLI